MKGQYRNFFGTIWTFSKGMHVKLVFTYIMFVFANLALMVEPYLLGKFINAIQEGGENIVWNSGFYLAILVLMGLVFWIFHGPSRCVERVMSFEITKNFLDRMFLIVTKLPLKWHRDNHSGTTIDKIEKAAGALRSFMNEAYVYIESIIPLIASITAIIIIMGFDGLYILLVAVIVFFIIFKFDKFLTWSLHEINKKEHNVASIFYDYISNITTIITLRLENLARSEYIRRIKAIFPLFRKRSVVTEVKWFVVDMFLLVAWFFLMMFYIYKTYNLTGVVMIGTVVMLYEYVDRFIQVFYGIAWKYERLVMTCVDLMAVKSIQEAYDTLYLKDIIKCIGKNWEKIEIRELYFKYEDARKDGHNLENVNIDLLRGKKIAFTGESGSGKSTLMTILRGLTVANRIKMEVDGKDYDDLRALAETTTLIPQDPEIFEDTIEYNITMGIPLRHEDMKNAVMVARFDKVVEKLPAGFGTDIRERGVNLSGGEKQRLALARGIFAAHDSTIVLLDEPTSSVDSGNERKIYENLFREFEGKCVISTVHRLHLLPLFDYIYVFENGRIAEEGSYDELMAKEVGILKSHWKNYGK